MYFFDVDGTLLSETDGHIPPSTKEAIEQLLIKGIKVVVATGRPYSLCSEFRDLGIETVISANGALITRNEKIIYRSTIHADTVLALSEFAALHGLGKAMGNGTERLKQKADFVTTKASEGGIAYALQVYGVI